MTNSSRWIKAVALAALPVFFGVSACTGLGGATTFDEASGWDYSDDDAWEWCKEAGTGTPLLVLEKRADYQPPHRSPHSLALAQGIELQDFDLEVEAKSTKEYYGHLDLCLIFGYRDPAHYLYAHLAAKADPNAHHVMLVDGAPRRPVTTERTEGVDWGDTWHSLKLTRRGEHVEVFFDGERVITAKAPLGKGRIGVGSFDDTGEFRNLRVTPK